MNGAPDSDSHKTSITLWAAVWESCICFWVLCSDWRNNVPDDPPWSLGLSASWLQAFRLRDAHRSPPFVASIPTSQVCPAKSCSAFSRVGVEGVEVEVGLFVFFAWSLETAKVQKSRGPFEFGALNGK